MSRQSIGHFNGGRLQELRKARGFTNENLARAADVTLRTIQRWQDGTAEPTGALLIRLARTLEVAPETFYASSADEADEDEAA